MCYQKEKRASDIIGRFIVKYVLDRNTYFQDDYYQDDEFICGGRACGNLSCGFEWSECEVENVRLFDNCE